MEKSAQALIQYIHALLHDQRIPAELPPALAMDPAVLEIDSTLRKLRKETQLPLESGKEDSFIERVSRVHEALVHLLQGAEGKEEMAIFERSAEAPTFQKLMEELQGTMDMLRDQGQVFEDIFAAIPDAALVLDKGSLVIAHVNEAFAALLGRPRQDLVGKRLDELSLFTQPTDEQVFLDSVSQGQTPKEVMLTLAPRKDRAIHGLISSAVFDSRDLTYIISVIKDVTPFKTTEEELRLSEKRLRLLADNATDVIWTMDLNGAFTYISPSVEKLRGYTVEEVMAQSREELLCPESFIQMEKGIEEAIVHVQNRLPFKTFRGDMEQPCKDGSTVWTSLTVSGIYDKDQNFLGMLGVTRDITERKKMEEEILRLSEVDTLTGLSNRLKLDATLQKEWTRSERTGEVFSLLLFDLDHFKAVNDTYGHLVGDAVLVELAALIRRHIRKVDTAGRWGGEEFMILLPATHAEGARAMAEKLRALIDQHHFPQVGQITASFGLATYEKGLDLTSLLGRADKAMYRAKETGKNKVCT